MPSFVLSETAIDRFALSGGRRQARMITGTSTGIRNADRVRTSTLNPALARSTLTTSAPKSARTTR